MIFCNLVTDPHALLLKKNNENLFSFTQNSARAKRPATANRTQHYFQDSLCLMRLRFK